MVTISRIPPFLLKTAPLGEKSAILRPIAFSRYLLERTPSLPYNFIDRVVVWVKDRIFSVTQLFFRVYYRHEIAEARNRIRELLKEEASSEGIQEIINLSLPYAKWLPDVGFFCARMHPVASRDLLLYWQERGILLTSEIQEGGVNRPLAEALAHVLLFEAPFYSKEKQLFLAKILLAQIEKELLPVNLEKYADLIGKVLPKLLRGDLTLCASHDDFRSVYHLHRHHVLLFTLGEDTSSVVIPLEKFDGKFFDRFLLEQSYIRLKDDPIKVHLIAREEARYRLLEKAIPPLLEEFKEISVVLSWKFLDPARRIRLEEMWKETKEILIQKIKDKWTEVSPLSNPFAKELERLHEASTEELLTVAENILRVTTTV